MIERAASYTLPHVPQTGDAGVRPKVMRRPAQFANKAITTQPLPTLLTQADGADNTKAIPHARAWQDDGRFAITLLAIVIIINIAVSAWLSALDPAPISPTTSIPLISSAPSELKIVHILDDDAATDSSNQ